MGSTPPLLRFQPTGPGARGPIGMQGPQLQARVGAPLDLTVWLTDDARHDPEPIPVKREAVPSMNVSWIKHSGPAASVTFSTPKERRHRSAGQGDDAGDLQRTGRVHAPRPCRYLRQPRQLLRRPVLLDERLLEGCGNAIVRLFETHAGKSRTIVTTLVLLFLAYTAILPAQAHAQKSDDAERLIAAFSRDWPDVYARLIALERAHGVLYGALDPGARQAEGAGCLSAHDRAAVWRIDRAPRCRGREGVRRDRRARGRDHPADAGIPS